MNKINLNVILASYFDKEEYSIDNIFNEIDYSEDGNDIAVVLITNGIYEEGEQLNFDFFLRKISSEGDNSTAPKKFLYLFSTEIDKSIPMSEGKKFKENSTKSGYPNWFLAIDGENIHINFPGRGDYELEVFKVIDSEKKEVNERYKEYRKEKMAPEALYCFKVK